MQSKSRQRIRCEADKINVHSHNPFPDIICNKQNTHHMKSSASLPCKNHKSCVHTVYCDRKYTTWFKCNFYYTLYFEINVHRSLLA